MGNEIRGNGGNDIIDGGSGDDIVYVTGNYSQARLTGTAADFTITDGGGGTDTVKNVEYIRFDDGVWTSANAISGGAAANATHSWRTPITSSTTQTGGQTGGVTNGDGATNIGNLALKDVKIETQGDAQNAVTILNRSLEQIATGRAKLGAVSNRLTHNLDNQTQASMMTQQARGRVVDTDMAIESTKLAQEQILSQAAQQAINMAMQRQQTVLMLLDT